ncbi:AAA domain-containing protein, partial [Psychroflexus sp. MES1-P1E]|uniref:AAA domain-containing protein n=1 Tax=Psychroflexus sp. MES1-P1E TaxID=2058320 RepID=UPI000CB2163D
KINVGFNSFDVEFLNILNKGDKIIFGISDPPLKYYFNLIDITKNATKNKRVEKVILGDYHLNNFDPKPISNSLDLIKLYKSKLLNDKDIIIQGPPGTGKTFFISRLILELLNQKKSILISTLANRSLIEIANKYFTISNAKKNVVYKSNLKLEESKEVKDLRPMPKDFMPSESNILLTTFYRMTGLAVEIGKEPVYDYLILEEASQCFLGTIAAAKKLGKIIIMVGDPLQLPPVVNQNNSGQISSDINLMLESFAYYASTINCPKYKFTTTFRLSEKACYQTNTFYNNSLKSKSEVQKNNSILKNLSSIYNNEGGSSLFYYDSKKLNELYEFIFSEIKNLLRLDSAFNIAILSSTKKGVKLLRDNLLHKFNDSQDQIIINTVDGVQGLTVDFCFYFAYSDGNPSFSFKINRFNVASSRAKYCTLILIDEIYKIIPPYKGLVGDFISKCSYSEIAIGTEKINQYKPKGKSESSEK